MIEGHHAMQPFVSVPSHNGTGKPCGPTVRAKAPLRISFAGGGTDVSPYPEERGGAVLNATINKYAYASLIPKEHGEIEVRSLDYDIVAKYHVNGDMPYDGELDLVKAAVRHMEVETGLSLFLHSDAPPGSGLGSSSTVVVALLGVLSHWLRRPMTNYDLAQLAYHIEREDLAIKGGKQDQYAATFGGFNFIEFSGSGVVVNPLRVPQSLINELEYRSVLCYTGKTRASANIVGRQIASYVEKRGSVVRALDATKEVAIAMKNALLQGRLDDFGDLLNEGWELKKRFDSAITTPQIDGMYAAARKLGATGGKILGAGGGGYLLLYCQFDRKHLIAQKLEEMGGQVVEFGFDDQGLQTWDSCDHFA
jgi:D-glycero-alpha-D-manno-heptose-7-phosphate kinase